MELVSNQPDPFIYEYYVRKLNYKVDTDGAIMLEFATRDELVVTTNDILTHVKLPDMFIVGWLECHHVQSQYQQGGQFLTRYKELYQRRDHDINLGLLQMFQNEITLAKLNRTALPFMKLRSFEQILLSCGWVFQLHPSEYKALEATPHRVPPEIADRVWQAPELTQYKASVASPQPSGIMDEPVRTVGPISELGTLSSTCVLPNPNSVSGLTLTVADLSKRLDQLTYLIGNLLNASNNSVGNSEQRASDAEREASDGVESEHSSTPESLNTH